MNSGDKVTGVPDTEDLRAKHPTVTGHLEIVPIVFGDQQDQVPMIMCGDIAVTCTDIRPATRREQPTEL